MSSIYLHIPFCKQACHYCDFHFSTSLKKKEIMILSLVKELEMRKVEFQNQVVETIYFGGGTPSLLEINDLKFLLETIYKNYSISKRPEITLEANPEDFDQKNNIFEEYKSLGINRLSVGIQSFFDDDLKMMNRAHTAIEARQYLEKAMQYFDSVSIDLIYGIPGMTSERWLENIETSLAFGVPHISSYALTVEPKTALDKMIQNGKIPAPKEEVAQSHFAILVETLKNRGFIHYELSNFSKEGYFSKNNSGYWLGKNYLGVGPSAHSYDGFSRSWNISNNSLYIQAIQADKLPCEKEILTKENRYNEFIMTGLRTIWGVDLEQVEIVFGIDYLKYLQCRAKKYIDKDLLCIRKNILKPSQKGLFLIDGIASDLFYLS